MSLVGLPLWAGPPEFCAHGASWMLNANGMVRKGRATHTARISSVHMHAPLSHQIPHEKYNFKDRMIKNYKGWQQSIKSALGPSELTALWACISCTVSLQVWSADIAKCWGSRGAGVAGSVTTDWNQWGGAHSRLCLGPQWSKTVIKDLKCVFWLRGARKAWPNRWNWS